MFYTGQRLVCIKRPAKCIGDTVRADMPKIDDVVTCRKLYVSSGGTPHVLLMEHDNENLAGKFWWDSEPGFPQDCFRPLAEPSTDISELRRALRGELVELLGTEEVG